jgi:hypothetical protein
MPLGISVELVAGFVSFLFTLMVLSYLVGDNAFFQLAIYVFIGVSAGYAASVAWQQVLWPKLFQPLMSNPLQNLPAIIPLLMGILLLAKLSPRSARLANPSMAFLVGVGAAVAVGGAVMGTLFPQVQASANLFDLTKGGSILEHLFEASVALVGTVTTLIYFHFGAKATPGGPQRSKLVGVLGAIGQGFIAVTFGVLFAGAYAAAMTALIERIYFLVTFF